MNIIRQQLAIMLHEYSGQELLDQLEKYCDSLYNEGYEDAEMAIYAPSEGDTFTVGC